ncbi:hypothetical protein JCM3774_004014 [Rhodotorula dairenensis]
MIATSTSSVEAVSADFDVELEGGKQSTGLRDGIQFAAATEPMQRVRPSSGARAREVPPVRRVQSAPQMPSLKEQGLLPPPGYADSFYLRFFGGKDAYIHSGDDKSPRKKSKSRRNAAHFHDEHAGADFARAFSPWSAAAQSDGPVASSGVIIPPTSSTASLSRESRPLSSPAEDLVAVSTATCSSPSFSPEASNSVVDSPAPALSLPHARPLLARNSLPERSKQTPADLASSAPVSPPAFSWSASFGTGQIFVKTDRRTVLVAAGPGESVQTVVDLVTERLALDADHFYLLFAGKVLQPRSILSDFGVVNGSTLWLHQRCVGGAGGTKRKHMPDLPYVHRAHNTALQTTPAVEQGRAAEAESRSRGRPSSAPFGSGTAPRPGVTRTTDGLTWYPLPKVEDYLSDEDNDPYEMGLGMFQHDECVDDDLANQIACAEALGFDRFRPTSDSSDAETEEEEVLREEKRVRRENKEVDALETEIMKTRGRLLQAEERIARLEDENKRLKSRRRVNSRPMVGAAKQKVARAWDWFVPDELASTSQGEPTEEPAEEDDSADVNEREYKGRWHDRSATETMNPKPFADALEQLIVVDIRKGSSEVRLPSTLYQLDPVLCKDKTLYAASRLAFEVENSGNGKWIRQFPEYTGDVFFHHFFAILRYSHRVVLDLFTVSPYLYQLLGSQVVFAWAKSPCASMLLRVGHAHAGKVYEIAVQINEAIQQHLASKTNLSRIEAARPRIVVQQVDTRGVGSYHSKQVVGFGRDRLTLFVMEGSANASNGGYGGSTSSAEGGAQKGKSFETGILLALPWYSTFARQHLVDYDNYFLHLYKQGRLIPTTTSSSAGISNLPAVRNAQEAVLMASAAVEGAEKRLEKARAQGWNDVLSENPAYTTKRVSTMQEGNKKIAGGRIVSAMPSTSSGKRAAFEAPRIAEKLVVHRGSDAKAGHWHHDNCQAGEVPEETHIMCCDCGSIMVGTMPPSMIDSYNIRHLPLKSPCAGYLTPTRSRAFSKAELEEDPALLKKAFAALMSLVVTEPVSEGAFVNVFLVWYSSLTKDLESWAWLPRLQRPGCTREDGGARHFVWGRPAGSEQIAAFGLADCLVRFAADNKSCKFAWDCVSAVLRELHRRGFSIVVIVNAGTGTTETGNRENLIPSIFKAVGVPVRLFIARGQDEYRKPATGIWDTYLRDYNEGRAVDLNRSFFVGHLAGRSDDRSDIDLKFAKNCGLQFFTPESHFGEEANNPGILTGWDPKSYSSDLPLFSPTSSPLVPRPPGEFEPPQPVDVVFFVGPPGAGKTTLYRKYFAPRGYLRISRDHSHSHSDCQKLLRENLASRNPSPCVIDALLPAVQERKEYTAQTLRASVPIRLRCLYFATPLVVATHNALCRALTGVLDADQHQQVIRPEIYDSYRRRLVAPSIHEGFDEIKTINFRFEGNAEKRRRWEMRLVDVFEDMDVTSW